MNERIKEFAEQIYGSAHYDDFEFAKLIINECIVACATERLGKTAGAEDLIRQHFGIES